MDILRLDKIDSLHGEVNLVGSKSLTNRALLLSALASGTTKLSNILRSADSAVMLQALRELGVAVVEDPQDPTVVTISGLGGVFAVAERTSADKPLQLFLGNAGTAMRPLTAALALSAGFFELTGEPRMYERPIGDLIEPLEHLGAKITYLGQEGYPPLLIQGAANVAGGANAAGANVAGAAHAAGAANAAGTAAAPAIAGAQEALTVAVAGNTSSQYISALLMVGALDRKSVV